MDGWIHCVFLLDPIYSALRLESSFLKCWICWLRFLGFVILCWAATPSTNLVLTNGKSVKMCGLCLPPCFTNSLDFHERNQLTAENHRKYKDEEITQPLTRVCFQSVMQFSRKSLEYACEYITAPGLALSLFFCLNS